MNSFLSISSLIGGVVLSGDSGSSHEYGTTLSNSNQDIVEAIYELYPYLYEPPEGETCDSLLASTFGDYFADDVQVCYQDENVCSYDRDSFEASVCDREKAITKVYEPQEVEARHDIKQVFGDGIIAQFEVEFIGQNCRV